MRIYRRLVFTLAFSLLVGLHAPRLTGQDVGTTTPALKNQDIIEMLKAGISPEVVLAKIKAGPGSFDTSPESLKALQAANIPDNVVLAMVAASAAPTKAPVAAEPAPSAPAGGETAHLRVYRQSGLVGAALAPSIYVDGAQIARIGNGRRCSIKLSSGAHTIQSEDKGSVISIDAKAGQEYFVRVDEAIGMWKGHGKLTLVPIEQGAPEYKLQKPVEPGRKIATDRIEADTVAAESK